MALAQPGVNLKGCSGCDHRRVLLARGGGVVGSSKSRVNTQPRDSDSGTNCMESVVRVLSPGATPRSVEWHLTWQ
eukprot:3047603-Rhodomonas_salina.1